MLQFSRISWPQVLVAFSRLCEDVWSRGQRLHTPDRLLHAMQSMHPQFADMGQHDSQEFLRYFFDTMHEELRREVRPRQPIASS